MEVVRERQAQPSERIPETQPETGAIVRKRRTWKRPQTMAVMASLGVFVCGVLVAYQYSAVAALGYEVYKAKKEVNQTQGYVEELRHEVETYKSLDRIERIATGKLRMERPANRELLAKEPAASAAPAPTAPAASPHTPPPANTQGTQSPAEGKNPLVQALVRLLGG